MIAATCTMIIDKYPTRESKLKGLSSSTSSISRSYRTSYANKAMAISKAFPLLLVLLLVLNSTFSFCHAVKQCPPPRKQSSMKCPRDTVKFGVCGSWLGLVHEVIGTPPSQECCSLVKGLADLEAAICLCTALKTSLLGVAPVKLPVALTLHLNSCGKTLPQGFVCWSWTNCYLVNELFLFFFYCISYSYFYATSIFI